MSQQPGPDPFERLVEADPVPDEEVPSASLARVHARIEESIAMASSTPAPRDRRLGLALIGVAVVAVAAFALAGAGGLFAGPSTAPPVANGPTAAPPDDGGAAGGGGLPGLLAWRTSSSARSRRRDPDRDRFPRL